LPNELLIFGAEPGNRKVMLFAGGELESDLELVCGDETGFELLAVNVGPDSHLFAVGQWGI
jgi:hypothetical protein